MNKCYAFAPCCGRLDLQWYQQKSSPRSSSGTNKSTLERADKVLVMCLGQYYIPACKYSLFVPPDGCILQLDGCSMHPDGCILPLDGLLSHLVIAPRQFRIATGWMYNATRQIYLATGWLFYCSS